MPNLRRSVRAFGPPPDMPPVMVSPGSGGSAAGSIPGCGAAGAAVSAQAAPSDRAVRRAAGEIPVAPAVRIVLAVEAGAAAGLHPNPAPSLPGALATLRWRLAVR